MDVSDEGDSDEVAEYDDDGQKTEGRDPETGIIDKRSHRVRSKGETQEVKATEEESARGRVCIDDQTSFAR